MRTAFEPSWRVITAYGRLRHGRRPIPLYLVGRGLQMLVRMERFGVRDEIQLARVRWPHEHRAWLHEVVASAIGTSGDPHAHIACI